MWNELIKYPFYVSIHPFKGFWDVKYEGKGRTKIALSILLLLTIIAILKRQYTGFVVNFSNPNTLNSLDELIYIILPFFLFCVANWAITTLMDGEGKFVEIITVTAYSLIPMVVIYGVTTIISNFITFEEAPLFFLLESAAMFWFLGLLFVGVMTVHQYSVSKTIATFILTAIVMGVIIFLGLLFFSLLQQLMTFVETIYREIIYRF
ncbi:YIP1 family protein [Bacillus sp. FJAT-49732]|uniref:YIP1 family protein n=1 Tax=Lederbergia citrisecunda TaxID=2833583 RepID=A0A942TPA2_9BACI|nr:Yip1 family protein [Lederbergia citrisecunda]MBS4201960.1 YIP1 family protein [Lederbergia citrisecunda]